MDTKSFQTLQSYEVNGDLNRPYQINMNVDREKETIKQKYRLGFFPTRCHSQTSSKSN